MEISKLMSRRSKLSVFYPQRSNLKIFLMPGYQSCVITGFTDRTRLCDLPGRPPFGRSLPQLLLTHRNRPRARHVKPRWVYRLHSLWLLLLFIHDLLHKMWESGGKSLPGLSLPMSWPSSPKSNFLQYTVIWKAELPSGRTCDQVPSDLFIWPVSDLCSVQTSSSDFAGDWEKRDENSLHYFSQ